MAAPQLLSIRSDVAALLGLDPAETPTLVEVLAGNRMLDGSKPYAACYGGHQFGNWAGQLGDGRAITITEVKSSQGIWELQLKGAGPTPYSRRSDGRAVLRSSLREYVCSEAMFHLGVPTTRALSLVTTGDLVVRDMLYDGHPEHEPGAIVCRVAPSFLRFGSYEIHTSRGDIDTLTKLVDFTLTRFFPEYAEGRNIAGFFEEVCRRTAHLVVEWLRVGFVHGVMNTDNMSILGLTLDYGPYGWIEPFDPNWTPNTTDAGGRRYRFGYQPQVAQWNLAKLGSALLPLVGSPTPLQHGLERFEETFSVLERKMSLSKLGLSAGNPDEDHALSDTLYTTLAMVETDMTLFFRLLANLQKSDKSASAEAQIARIEDAYYAKDALPSAAVKAMGNWLHSYVERLVAEDTPDDVRRHNMNRVNPLYVPRNYLVQQVIDQVQGGNVAALVELMDVLSSPYDERPGREHFTQKRPEWARNKPGCSMLSCSS